METDEKVVLCATVFAVYALPDYVDSLPARLAIDAALGTAAAVYIAHDEPRPVPEEEPVKDLPSYAFPAIIAGLVVTAWLDHTTRHWLADKLPLKRPHTVIGAGIAALSWFAA